MSISWNRIATSAAVLFGAIALAIVLPGAAQAKKAKSTQTEAVWIAFDAAAKTVTVKVKNPGKGPNRKLVEKNEEVVFKVKPEGSVLTRTTVSLNGVKGELTDIPAGKSVNVYWVPEGDDKFARKIDVVLSEEEINKRTSD